MFFRYSCHHDLMALCSLWDNNPLSRELSFHAQPMSELPRGPHPPPVPMSTGEQHLPSRPSNVSQTGGQLSDGRSITEQPSCLRPGHDRHAMPSTVQPAIIFLATSYTCVKYVAPATVPGSVPIGSAPLSKSTPWTLL